ncbi:MAG: AMP-binding protein [Rhodoferax sp.]|nr:AMP-binding protein [Rhodoferax sp.]
MTPAQASGLVHLPLQEWAYTRAQTPAIASASQTLTFAQLQQAVSQRAHALTQTQAPASVWVDAAHNQVARLVDFLGIVASGRAAAVADPDWPSAVATSVHAALPMQPCTLHTAQPDAAFYIGFTSGSTGLPKGFRRSHRSWVESFKVCQSDFGPLAGSRLLVPGRDAHSLFLFGMLLGLWTGAGVVVQERFSAAAVLEVLRQGQTPGLVSTPSQLVLLLDLAQHRQLAPLLALRLILISGARWLRHRTPELQALFPQARIIEFYGACETSFIAWMDSAADAPSAVVGHPFSTVALQLRPLPNTAQEKAAPLSAAMDKAAPEASLGLIYVRSPMLFMDYVQAVDADPDASAALRDGEWLTVHDIGYLDAQGRLCLGGRARRMIVTRGKNLFAEELEAVLQAHPAIAAASVHGVADARRGAQVVAIIRWANATDATVPADPQPDTPPTRPSAQDIRNWCQHHLEAYKAPRKLFVCANWPFTASGKTQHSLLADSLQAHLQPQSSPLTPTPSLLCPPPLQALP